MRSKCASGVAQLSGSLHNHCTI